MTKKRVKDREAARSKANLGQKEAKQEALSKGQFSHMKGGKVADSLESKNRKDKPNAKVSSFASSQVSHLVQRPDFDLARSRHGIGAALHPGDRLVHVLDLRARSRRPARGSRRRARR